MTISTHAINYTNANQIYSGKKSSEEPLVLLCKLSQVIQVVGNFFLEYSDVTAAFQDHPDRFIFQSVDSLDLLLISVGNYDQ